MRGNKQVMEENAAANLWRYKVGEHSALNNHHSSDELFSWSEGTDKNAN